MSNTMLPPGAIAIVGLAARFPGARTARDYWRMLDEGRDATVRPSDEALLAAGESPEALADPLYVRAAMPLDDVACFDAGFFGFTPREAAILDPQHRHFLEACWEALEDGGHTPAGFEGAIGVFAGCGMQSYFARNLLTNRELVDQVGMFLLRHTGNDKDFLTTRVSYLLDLQGPSVGVQTACSTSLVAVHMACQSLLSGECDMALAGGVTIEAPYGLGYRYAEGEVLSSTGQCRAFDESGDGTVFGSGAGVVALRRLEDAVRDQDHIYAIIRGSAVNNDGAGKAGYLAPSVEGQARAAAEALAIAQVDPASVDYIEAHGTGTRIGDPIELAALQQAYEGAPQGSLLVGSVKPNIGHLDTAAGVASLIKAALALRCERLPKTLHFKTPNTRFDFKASPFSVLSAPRDWRRGGRPRRAAVNSLGVGGTNAHVVLEEAPVRASTPAPSHPQLVLLSGKTPEALVNLRNKWAAHLVDAPHDFNACDAAFTTDVGRKHFAHRMALIGADAEDLHAAARGTAPHRVVQGLCNERPARVIFMFPGGGAQYPGAGRALYDGEPVFKAAVEACFAALPASAPDDLRALMFAREPDDADAAAALAQPLHSVLAVFILEYAMAQLWRSWGVTPAGVIGHSLGEYAAAAVAGVMRLEDALATVALRGEIFAAVPRSGMLSVRASEETVRGLLPAALDIAVINADDLVVVSGENDALDGFQQTLARAAIDYARVRIEVAAHSRLLEPFLPRYRAHLEGLSLRRAAVPVMSNLSGAWMTPDEPARAEYWVRQLRSAVCFRDGLAAALDQPDVILLEVGPGQALSALARLAQAKHEPAAILASMGPPCTRNDDIVYARAAAGALWAHGASLDLAALRAHQGRRVPAPTYGFARTPYWIDAPKGSSTTAADVGAPAIARAPDSASWVSAPVWSRNPHPAAATNAAAAPWLVLAGDDDVSVALVAALRAKGATVFVARPGDGFTAAGAEATLRPDSVEDFAGLIAHLDAAGRPGAIVHAWSLQAPAYDGRVAQPLGFDSLLLLGQAMELNGWEGDRALCVATRGVFSTQGEAITHPERALLVGPVRVLPREMPGLSASLIDVGAEVGAEAAAQAIIAGCLGRDAHALVALRADGRWTQVEAATADSEARAPRLRERGTYLISGGLGALGLTFAAHVARTCKARLVLTTREAFPERGAWPRIAASDEDSMCAERVRALLAIEAQGGAVHVVTADLADADAARRAIAAAEAEFGPLNGVFHLSGAIDDAVAAAKTTASAYAVIAAKLTGAFALHEALRDRTLDVFGVFSSTSALIGPPGQCDYAGANAALDALAESRADGLSMAWGVWTDIGMAARQATPATDGARMTHPLLGYRTRSGGAEVFTARIRPSRFWALEEHRIAGRAVLPGTAYLDACMAAAQAVSWRGGVEICDVNFLAPLMFAGDAPRTLRTTLHAAQNGKARITIESRRAPAEAWTLHFEAKLQTPPPRPRTARSIRPLAPIEQSRLNLAERGVAFGPRWACLKEAWRALDSAGGEIALPMRFHDDRDAHPLHPATLDVAMTVGLFARDGDSGEKIFAPVSLESLAVYAALPARYTAVAHARPSRDDDLATFDVRFTNARGGVLAEMRGLTLRRVDPAALSAIDRAQPAIDPDAPLFDRMLACGLRGDDAPAAFAHALAAPGRRVIVSSIPLPALRAAYRTAPVRAAAAGGRPAPAIDDPYEARIAAWCADILGVPSVAPTDEFLAFGGGSLTGVRLFAKIRKEMGVDLALSALFQTPTIRELAALVRTLAGDDKTAAGSSGAEAAGERGRQAWSPLVRINAGKPGKAAFFCVHGAEGNVVLFKPLADRLGADRPFYALQAQGVDGASPPHETIAEMAAAYCAAIRTVQPHGPYTLAGYSGGGVIAFEMARQLRACGERIACIVMFDTLEPEAARARIGFLDKAFSVLRLDPQFLLRWPRNKIRALGWDAAFARVVLRRPVEEVSPIERAARTLWDAYAAAQSAYVAPILDVDILLFRATQAAIAYVRAGDALGWRARTTGAIHVIDAPASHERLFSAPAIDVVAFHLKNRLKALDAAEAPARVLETAD
ncbi:MAG: beta-ketoacyl synthase N-terminal-like domain-containing protein [Hyphomonadaceae bacterium]|nr:beta-ketoacyl synthase N-terminal-like domain-containing protein [Hyphomonadaceae bacterium]